jgi:hypothetical protein
MKAINSQRSHVVSHSRTPSILILFLLFLASVHCVTSIFFVNYSYLDLKAYAAGNEMMPYQGRIGMMPVIQLAESSPRWVALAQSIDNTFRVRHPRSRFQEVTPESLACIAAGGVALLVSVAIAVFYGLKRFDRLWWLPATLLLAMLYVTQAARYETALWYPYDLPHAALFGAACLFVLEGEWLPVLLIFLVDLPVRETAIFLAPITVTVAWARNQRPKGLLVAALMLLAWVPFRIYIHHRFAGNHTELGLHYRGTILTALNPFQWPQIASAFGFLLIPLCVNYRLLSRTQRYFLLGALPCFLATLAFGVWPETRIFEEWLLPASVLLTTQIASSFEQFRKAPQGADVEASLKLGASRS